MAESEFYAPLLRQVPLIAASILAVVLPKCFPLVIGFGFIVVADTLASGFRHLGEAGETDRADPKVEA